MMRPLENAQWDLQAGENTGRILLLFGGPVCTDRISNCPWIGCINTIKYSLHEMLKRNNHWSYVKLDHKNDFTFTLTQSGRSIFWPR